MLAQARSLELTLLSAAAPDETIKRWRKIEFVEMKLIYKEIVDWTPRPGGCKQVKESARVLVLGIS